MTREEALNKAINIVRYFEANFAKSKEAREDLENIIEALEQEPCEDCISRKEVFNQIFYSTDNSGDVVLGSELRSRFERLPSVTPQEPRWIPVSERLPEDEQEILFSTRTGRVHSGKYHDDGSANPWYSHRDKCRAWNNVVTAWMPLPQPYKAESEDKE